MLSSLSSKAIMAKAMAMYGSRITTEQYRELLCKKSVAEIAAYLKDATGYKEALAGIQPGAIHRGQLELLLRKERFARYSRLIHYDLSGHDSYYHYFIVEFEIQQILMMVQLMDAGNEEEYLAQYPLFMQKSAQFDMMALAKVRSYDDLLRVLATTPYRRLLETCRPENGEQIDYTRCEVVLMSYFYKYVEKLIDSSFHGRTRRELHDIFQTRLELRNIGTIFRIKKYYPETTPDEVRNYILPVWKRIPDRELENLIAAPSADEFLARLAQSPFSKMVDSGDFVFIEYTANHINYNLNRRYLRFATDAPTAFTAYMTLSSLELKNITMIIESVRYGVTPGDIQKMLVN